MEIKNKKFIYFNSTEIVKTDIVWGLVELDIDVVVSNVKLDINDFTENDDFM